MRNPPPTHRAVQNRLVPLERSYYILVNFIKHACRKLQTPTKQQVIFSIFVHCVGVLSQSSLQASCCLGGSVVCVLWSAGRWSARAEG